MLAVLPKTNRYKLPQQATAHDRAYKPANKQPALPPPWKFSALNTPDNADLPETTDVDFAAGN